MGNRAVSPVLGMVILAGLVVIVGLSVLVVGLTVLGGAQSTAETSQAEASMVEFADTANEVAEGGARSGTFALSGPEDGTAWVNDSAGRVEIALVDDNTTQIAKRDLGAYKYTTADGTEIAYQGGGVWRKDESGSTVMVDSPAMDYRIGEEPTLTLDLVKLDGSGTGNGFVEGELDVQDRTSLYPANASQENPLPGGELHVDIESEYCLGWEEYVRERTAGKVVEDCWMAGNTSTGEFRTELSVPTVNEASGAVIASENLSYNGGGNANVNGTVVIPGGNDSIGSDISTGSVTDRDVSIEETDVSDEVADCDTFQSTVPQRINGSESPYCFTKITTAGGNRNLTVEPEQDVEIVVRDKIDISGSNGRIAVENGTGDHNVTIYVAGPVKYASGIPMGNPDDPPQTQLYTNDTVRIQGSSAEFYGLIYAPSPTPPSWEGTVEVNGNAEVEGSVISTNVHLQGSGSRIDWHPGMEGLPLGPTEDENPVYYLHVTESHLSVNG